MTYADLIDAIGQTGPAMFMCWYAMHLKRENAWLRTIVAQQSVKSDSQAGHEEPIPEPLPVARASYKTP